MDLNDRIDLVARSWTPSQQSHPGNVAWHGSGCDGAPAPDAVLDGNGWFAEVWHAGEETEVEGHFSPGLSRDERRLAVGRIFAQAPRGSISLVTGTPMADTFREAGAHERGGPFFLLQHRGLGRLPRVPLAPGYSIVTAEEAGEAARVEAHRRAWAPARIKELLGLTITGDEPGSNFTLDAFRALKAVVAYRPELDLVVLAPDGGPAALALGWYDERSRSVLFEPVGTVPEHARRGLARAVCVSVMTRARESGATQAVVGPRGDDAYPVPRRLYGSLGFSTLTRTCTLAWKATP